MYAEERSLKRWWMYTELHHRNENHFEFRHRYADRFGFTLSILGRSAIRDFYIKFTFFLNVQFDHEKV